MANSSWRHFQQKWEGNGIFPGCQRGDKLLPEAGAANLWMESDRVEWAEIVVIWKGGEESNALAFGWNGMENENELARRYKGQRDE